MAANWMRRTVLVAACASAALLAACGSSTTESAIAPERFVAFGDANSDVGQKGTRYTVNDGSVNNWTLQVAANYGKPLAAASAGGKSYAVGNARVKIKPDAAGNASTATITGLRGATPPPRRAQAMIDEFPILAAVAAFADGETRITGAAELRVKESDRITLMVDGLRACGVEAEELPDGLVVNGRGPKSVRGGAEIRTLGDHRIAMSFLVLGLGSKEPVTVDDADMIATSFPGFATFMQSLGADIVAL